MVALTIARNSRLRRLRTSRSLRRGCCARDTNTVLIPKPHPRAVFTHCRVPRYELIQTECLVLIDELRAVVPGNSLRFLGVSDGSLVPEADIGGLGVAAYLVPFVTCENVSSSITSCLVDHNHSQFAAIPSCVGCGPEGTLVVVVVVGALVVVVDFEVVVVVGALVVLEVLVVEAAGGVGSGPSHRRQYSLPTVRGAEHFTPLFHRVNCSALMPNMKDRLSHVSPSAAAHKKEQSRALMTPALATPARATAPRMN